MHRPGMAPSHNKSERPSIVKDTDLKSLDQEKDDTGWAGAQDEVDYNAKLNFDESDDSDEDKPSQKKSDLRKESRKDKVCVLYKVFRFCLFNA